MSQSRSKSAKVSSCDRDDKISSSTGYPYSDRRYDSHDKSSSHVADVSEADISISEDFSIEADGEFDAGGDFDALVADEDLDAAFEAEQGGIFCVVDEVGADRDKIKMEESEHATQCLSDGERQVGTPGGDDAERKFVIPKLKRPDSDKQQHDASYSSSEEGKREWRKNERDSKVRDRDTGRRDGSRGERERSRPRDSQNGLPTSQQPQTTSPRGRVNLFDSFVAEGLIQAEKGFALLSSAAGPVVEELDEAAEEEEFPETTAAYKAMEGEKAALIKKEGAFEIPMGRDSLAFVRGKLYIY